MFKLWKQDVTPSVRQGKMLKQWKQDVTPSARQEKKIKAVEARCHS